MKLRLACILGVLALVFGAAASAQTPAQSGAESTLTGTVVSATGTSLVIRGEDGTEQTFDVDTTSTIPAGLMSGSRVSVRFHNMAGGRRHVASVTTDPAPTTPALSQPMPDTATQPMRETATPVARVSEPAPAGEAAMGERLPDTASGLPLLALAGLMALGAGLVLRELRRRTA